MDDVPGLTRAYPPERLVPSSPAWPARYRALADAVLGCLGPAWQAEHVGSTSVPGLCAKPVVDLALRCPPGVAAPAALRPLETLGWTPPVDLGTHLAVFLPDADGVRRAIGHVYAADAWDDAAVRLFADRLRRCPDEAERYALLKTQLVADGVWGEAYTQAKTAFVEAVVARARAERAR